MLCASAFTENLLQPKENKQQVKMGIPIRKENRERFFELCTLIHQKREMLVSEPNIAWLGFARIRGQIRQVTPVISAQGNLLWAQGIA